MGWRLRPKLRRLFSEPASYEDAEELPRRGHHLCRECKCEVREQHGIDVENATSEERVLASPLRSKTHVKRDYEIGSALFEGDLTTMKLLTCKRTGRRCACVVMPLPGADASVDDRMRDQVFSEIDLLLSSEHSNLLRLKGFYIGKNNVYLVTEPVEGGRLLNTLLQREEYIHTEEAVQAIFRQILSCLEYLHKSGATYRDLLLDSLLLTQPGDVGNIKIVDFGLWEYISGKKRSVVGTPKYFPPEAIRARVDEFNKSVDMLSAGVLLYLLLSGEAPFYDQRANTIVENVKKGAFSFQEKQWSVLSPQAKDLVSKLLVAEHAKRLTASEALQHEWVTSAVGARSQLSDARKCMGRRNGAVVLERSAAVVSAINQVRNDGVKNMILRCWWVLGRSAAAPMHGALWALFNPNAESNPGQQPTSGMPAFPGSAGAGGAMASPRQGRPSQQIANFGRLRAVQSEVVQSARPCCGGQDGGAGGGGSSDPFSVWEEQGSNEDEVETVGDSHDVACPAESPKWRRHLSTMASAPNLRQVSSIVADEPQSTEDFLKRLAALRLPQNVAPITMPDPVDQPTSPASLQGRRSSALPLRRRSSRRMLHASASSISIQTPGETEPLILVRIKPQQDLITGRTQRWRPQNRRRMSKTSRKVTPSGGS